MKRLLKPNFFKNCISMMWAITIACIAFSMCASAICGANIEKIRKRRVEAIRGQILSKLGKTQLPGNNEPAATIPLPKDIEEMYNRTRDFVLEQARRKREECAEADENYYARDIMTITATDPPTSDQVGRHSLHIYRSMKKKQHTSEFFYFDAESARLDPDNIVSATLRLYQVQTPSSPHGGSQQVYLYLLSPPEVDGAPPQKLFITMNTIDTYGEGWKSFDVTSALREWVRLPKLNFGLELTPNCAQDSSKPRSNSQKSGNQQLEIMIAGSSDIHLELQPRGDQEDQTGYQEFLSSHDPHIMIMTHSNHVQHHLRSSNRQKRSLDADYCFRRNPSEPNCCLRELFIDFRRDLGWNWIRTPSGYKANFCAGACPYLWSMDSQHSKILSLYQSMNPQASSAPCCSPKELEPIVIMYFERGRYRFTQLPDMVVLSCNCN